MQHLLALAASPALRPFVTAYWFVRDDEGVLRGEEIRTSPHGGAVLTVNFGRPNRLVGGPPVPRASLLGPQTAERRWRSNVETSFVMAMLTPAGLASLFPGCGSAVADGFLDLGALVGDGATNDLTARLGSGRDPAVVTGALDDWLMGRLERSSAAAAPKILRPALGLLSSGARVSEAAFALGLSRRRLHRVFSEHLGVGPKEHQALLRFQRSLRAAQAGGGDALFGFSDQAHQIREWRRRIGTTPRRYATVDRLPMVEQLNLSMDAAPAFYV